MEAEKTVGISFRITPRMKRMLHAAAEHERRSLTNFFEILVEDYCLQHGINGQQGGGPDAVVVTREKFE
ncbi:type II toxin-antitoxin system TacA family antitoxin [Diaphorobacter caeni]|uniref:hypothetical protein n=1 Tax=Diaphorobacter caeni TaxID=2784387 RepID=UPI0018906F14|nr:hypothetical protein [Diaphorobacter caeni]MBF5006183.1 hypothetical protein [Diaphorobacter caeni]